MYCKEGETALARTTSIFFFIKPVPWRTKAWRLTTTAPSCRGGIAARSSPRRHQRQYHQAGAMEDGGVELERMPLPCRCGWWRGARQDDAKRQHQPGTAKDRGVELARRTPSMSTSSRWSPRPGAMKMTHALGAARNTEPAMRGRWRYTTT